MASAIDTSANTDTELAKALTIIKGLRYEIAALEHALFVAKWRHPNA